MARLSLKIFYFFILFSVFYFTPLLTKAAQNECDFSSQTESIKIIQAAQQGELGSDNLLTELKARKDLLKSSVDCLKSRTADLQNKIRKINRGSNEIRKFAEWLERQREGNESYYLYKETQIDDLGIKGSKDFAKELNERKTQIDEPLEGLVNGIVDWSNSKNLFEVGTKRLQDIKKTIDAFDLPEENEIVQMKEKASNMMNQALEEYQQSWKYLSNYQLEEGREKTRKSLEKLAEIYSLFLQISDESKKLLPL